MKRLLATGVFAVLLSTGSLYAQSLAQEERCLESLKRITELMADTRGYLGEMQHNGASAEGLLRRFESLRRENRVVRFVCSYNVEAVKNSHKLDDWMDNLEARIR